MPTVREKYGQRLDAIPALARFCEQAEALVRADDPETFWDVEPFFQELLATDVVEAFVAYELDAIARRPFHFLIGSSEFHAPLVETASYALVVKVLPPEALASAPVVSLTEHMLLAVWDGPVEVERLALQRPFRNDVFDRSARLVAMPSTTLVPGMVARFRSPSEAFRLRLERPAVLIQLQSATVASLRWVFSPDTLEPVRAAAARLSSSRLQFTCHTLAALGSPTSIPALKKLTAHPEHYVRWAAIQSICAISRDDGLECLRLASEDDHPHVRRAAEKTLARC
jgi:hypothetical protein